MVITLAAAAGGLALGFGTGATAVRYAQNKKITIHPAKGATQSIFDACVYALLAIADKLGISYEAVNVALFCILWPLLTLGLMVTIIILV